MRTAIITELKKRLVIARASEHTANYKLVDSSQVLIALNGRVLLTAAYGWLARSKRFVSSANAFRQSWHGDS